MSILRRKGKQFANGKDQRGREKERAKGAKYNYELLSNDIHGLLQVFYDEANVGQVSFIDCDFNFADSLMSS